MYKIYHGNRPIIQKEFRTYQQAKTFRDKHFNRYGDVIKKNYNGRFYSVESSHHQDFMKAVKKHPAIAMSNGVTNWITSKKTRKGGKDFFKC